MTSAERKLLFLLASVVRNAKGTSCPAQDGISALMKEIRGGVKEHLKAEAERLRREKEQG